MLVSLMQIQLEVKITVCVPRVKFSSCQRLTREGKLATAFPVRFPAISLSRIPTNPIFKPCNRREKAKRARSSMMRVNL